MAAAVVSVELPPLHIDVADGVIVGEAGIEFTVSTLVITHPSVFV